MFACSSPLLFMSTAKCCSVMSAESHTTSVGAIASRRRPCCCSLGAAACNNTIYFGAGDPDVYSDYIDLNGAHNCFLFTIRPTAAELVTQIKGSTRAAPPPAAPSRPHLPAHLSTLPLHTLACRSASVPKWHAAGKCDCSTRGCRSTASISPAVGPKSADTLTPGHKLPRHKTSAQIGPTVPHLFRSCKASAK